MPQQADRVFPTTLIPFAPGSPTPEISKRSKTFGFVIYSRRAFLGSSKWVIRFRRLPWSAAIAPEPPLGGTPASVGQETNKIAGKRSTRYADHEDKWLTTSRIRPLQGARYRTQKLPLWAP